jgi:hypothetical protein
VVDFETQVAACSRWIALHARRGDRRRPTSSYALKHAVQRWAGHYVSGPAFVEGARRAGFRALKVSGSGNAWIAMRVTAPWPTVDARA